MKNEKLKRVPKTGNPSLFFILNSSFFIYLGAYFSLYTTA
jgi:hypothetical protein